MSVALCEAAPHHCAEPAEKTTFLYRILKTNQLLSTSQEGQRNSVLTRLSCVVCHGAQSGTSRRGQERMGTSLGRDGRVLAGRVPEFTACGVRSHTRIQELRGEALTAACPDPHSTSKARVMTAWSTNSGGCFLLPHEGSQGR